jgi:carboxyl-terminal processing protease
MNQQSTQAVSPEIPEKQNSYFLPKKIFFTTLLVILAFYVGMAWGKRNISTEEKVKSSDSVASFVKNLTNPKDLFDNTEKDKPDKVDFDIFWKAWDKVDKKYVDENKLDPQKMVYGAIKGMIGSLGDPYSGFMDPQEAKNFNTDLEGSFEGIGAELGMKDNVLTVIAPIEGMPAQTAGLRSGDKIFKINGELTSDISIDEAVKKIRGPKGTEVTLTIVREGDSKTQDIVIKRDTIEVKSVIYEKKEGNIGYIRITKFAEDTSKEFNKAAATAIADGDKGIIIDVRNNPGGFLNVAVEIASKFVPKDEVVVWEQSRNGDKNAFKALGGDSMSELPVVVLINEGSASASEILSGALRDDKHNKLIGKKSFGKGSVQQLEQLSDGSSLKITIAKWLTPSGQSIHQVGLSPDIEVDYTEDDYNNQRDPQLDKALEEIKSQIK